MLICTVKPPAVTVGVPNAGVRDEFKDVSVVVAEPLLNPVFAVVIVAVEFVPVATPVTVIKPPPLMDTEPDAVAVPPHE